MITAIVSTVLVIVVLVVWMLHVHGEWYRMGFRHGRELAEMEREHREEILREVAYRERVEADIADSRRGDA